ncbi:MAG TPA: pyridoxamine 5'-phosphate oxidase, partial [Chthoniobacterales bacterium]|nr:pyridoxamine 5'-phosphate oxidase [Chthoniobacterales bacterium]
LFAISFEPKARMDTGVDVARMRKEYTLRGLHRSDLLADPFQQFARWFEESVQSAGDREPNAMTLATATPDGRPSARVVLLKGFDHESFVFFTNYESRKGEQLERNPRAALNFHWPWLERQIQIEGPVRKVSREESQIYFDKRPLASRLSAIISAQSKVIGSRRDLEERLKEVEKQLSGTNPPVPDFWGGYRVFPERIEFWQGRENRLHDRFLYERQSDGSWRINRLSP